MFSGRQGRSEHLLDIDTEGGAIHRPVENPGGDQAIATQAADEDGGLPVAPERLADQPLTDRAASISARHLGAGAGFIDEHKSFGIKVRLHRFPALARLGDIGPLLLSGVQSFF